MQHSLFGLEIWAPIDLASKSKLVGFRKRLESFTATSMLDSLPSYVAKQGSNCTVLCRALHVLPPFVGNGEYLRGVFNTGIRDHADADFWLVGMLNRGEEGMREVRQWHWRPFHSHLVHNYCLHVPQAKALADSLSMDIDDQVYFYVEAEEDPQDLLLLEIYKMRPELSGQVLDYGRWTPRTGLEVSLVDIWQRRRDLQASYAKLPCSNSKNTGVLRGFVNLLHEPRV